MATPQQRSTAARIGAHASWAQTADRAARTEPARRAAIERFERLVDPDNLMTPQQRARAAESARREAMTRLSARAAAARQRRTAA